MYGNERNLNERVYAKFKTIENAKQNRKVDEES